MEKIENLSFNQQELTEAEKVLGNQPSFEERMNKIKNAKTWQEKAQEKGYYQDETGEWWEHFDDGWGDERVPSFKLDVEYPEFADMVEEIAEKKGIKLYDVDSGLKMIVYNKADELSKLSQKTIDNMFTILSSITCSTSGTEEIVLSRNEEDTSKSLEKLYQYYNGLSNEAKNDKRSERMVGGLAETFIRNYNEDLATDDFMMQLSRGASLAQTDKEKSHKIFQVLESGITGFSDNNCDGNLFGNYLDFTLQLLKDDSKITKYDSKVDVVRRYVQRHGFNEDTVEGFNDVIFPLLEKGDSEVGPIMKGGNAYGVAKYQYGIADYTEECLLSRCTPQEIDRLNRIYHEIPTSDYYKFEQNRQDAGRIQGIIIGGRDFIHDEMPGVHEILSAMEKYYDAKDEESRKSIRQSMVELDKKYPYAGFLENALDLDNYNKEIEKMSEYHLDESMRGKTEGYVNEKAIDVLRRLVRNTAPEEISSPKTRYEELNQFMKDINPVINERTGEVKVSLDEVAPAITEMNRILVENQKSLGVFPSTISAISYLDKMAANALRGLDKKDITEVIYDPGFKEILRFSQLTSSMGYNESDFESFYSKACDNFSKAYEDDGVDSAGIRDGWRFVGQKITENMSALGKKYGTEKSTERFVGAVWSGNLSHELIGMFERV